MEVNLAEYSRRKHNPGAGLVKRILWYCLNALVFNSWLVPSSGWKGYLLRAFGAKVGNGIVIKPRVNIKYPWFLDIGDNVWVGEGVWVDNLCQVTIESNVCLSQETYLLTGNHNYKKPTFELITKEIVLEDGAWVGARAVVCPGVRIGKNAVITVGSVLSSDAKPNGIYRGNPAKWVRERVVVDG